MATCGVVHVNRYTDLGEQLGREQQEEDDDEEYRLEGEEEAVDD